MPGMAEETTPTPKRRGRPPINPSEHSVPVQVKMGERLYAAVSARARAQRITIPELVRRDLARVDRARSKTG